MIVFHEGLPGAGKSYEACVYHILPALLAGRRVITNIEGVNHDKFSEATGIPVAIVRQFLVCVWSGSADEEKQAILTETVKDSLVVIDEIQNLFPSVREKLTEQWSKYISEHRHDGLDIILMGQDRRDVHAMWRRRVHRLVTFQKLTALGQEKRYAWIVYEATVPERFKKVTSGVRRYDDKYFGLYKSVTDGTNNKSAYADKRAVIWRDPKLRYGVPVVFLAVVYAISHLVGFFSPDDDSHQPVSQTVQVSRQQPPRPASPPAAVRPVQRIEVKPEEPEPEPEYTAVDVFDDLAHKNRLRLSAHVVSQSDPSRIYAVVDVLSSTYHVRDSFSVPALRDLGWNVTLRDSGLLITKGDRRYLARPWPIDKPGRVDNETRVSFRPD